MFESELLNFVDLYRLEPIATEAKHAIEASVCHLQWSLVGKVKGSNAFHNSSILITINRRRQYYDCDCLLTTD